MAAREVLLPVPVAPTNSTRPRLTMASSLITAGRFSSSMVGIFISMRRITMPTALRW